MYYIFCLSIYGSTMRAKMKIVPETNIIPSTSTKGVRSLIIDYSCIN